MKVTSSACSILLMTSLLSICLQAQTPAMEAYEYAQAKRDQAWVYFDSLPKSAANFRTGILMLDSALSYLDQPRVQELANENVYVRFRRFDVSYDLAVGYALLGDINHAFDYLRKAAEVDPSASSTVERMEREKAFDILRQQAAYKELVQRFNLFGSMFDNRSLLTQYSANLSDGEKLAGVTLLWNVVKNKFVYFDHVPGLDWNKTYLEYLANVTSTRTTLEYVRMLQKMCALLKDGHTNVYPPTELRDSIYARPPLRTIMVEDKVIIAQVLSDSLLRYGFRPGQEIITIDGWPVKRYAEQFIQPFLSSSTPQDLGSRTYTYSLLAGNSRSNLTLELRDGRAAFTKTLSRSGYTDVKRPPDFEYRHLDHNIAYLALNSFQRDTIVTLFKTRFEEILKADGLIIDLRTNGGGSGNIGFDILAHLTNHPFQFSKNAERAEPDNLSWKRYAPGTWNPAEGKTFSKPVVVLISSLTFSAAEDFVVAFDAMKRGKLIGESTGGSTGEPFQFKLPGGLSGRVCMKRVTYPDGKEFVGVGIQPHIVVTAKVADIREGRDPVLEKAIEYLSMTPSN
ncbi:MAG: S41 family peptidase [Ignavibacteria bacterium]|nr:S41 family peptidase [Ignavibacteria bacterium]